MIRLTKYRNTSVGVMGLGKAGMAAVRALLASDATVYAWDDSEQARHRFSQDAAVAKYSRLKLQEPGSWPWRELAGMVLSPGIALTFPAPHPSVLMASEAKVPVVGEVDLLYETCPEARYIAITGTNGKSTTTALIAHILQHAGKRVQVGANFGTPALGLGEMGEDGWYILEMSSYQLDLTKSAFFHGSVLLNISPDHLERHGGMEGYINAKKRIFSRQREKGLALVALDDGYCRDIYIELVREHRPVMLPVAITQKLEKGIYVSENGTLHDCYGEEHYEYGIGNLPHLSGPHNWQNIAAAYGLARHYGVMPDTIMEAVASFGGLAHRLELVMGANGVRFYNDSKATNAEAAARALAAFDEIYWIVGGRAKAGGIESLEPYFDKINYAFLIGEAEEAFAAQLQGKVGFARCKDLETATRKAASMAFTDRKENAVVLLSPACASFDQWPDFEARGDAFREYVKELAANGVA